MGFIQSNRKFTACLFQVFFLFFILFAAFNEAPDTIHTKQNSKPLFCIGSGSLVVVREASEQVTSSVAFIKNYSFEKLWRCAQLLQSNQLLTNLALGVSCRAYHIFYLLTTIHAP